MNSPAGEPPVPPCAATEVARRRSPPAASRACVFLLGALVAGPVAAQPPARHAPAASAIHAHSSTFRWPADADTVRFENVEGVMLIPARLRGPNGRDTTGVLVLDTGSGYLALDHPLALRLGISDTLPESTDIVFARRPITRLSFGTHEMDQVQPVLTIDGSVIRSSTDRAALGLLGQRALADAVVVVDYPSGTVGFLRRAESTPRNPNERNVRRRIATSRVRLAGVVTKSSYAVPFDLLGDGKMVLSVRAGDGGRQNAPLRLILDTGSTKTVLFEPSLSRRVKTFRSWPTLRGLSAPTLVGASDASMVLVPELVLDVRPHPIHVRGMDAAVLRSDLAEMLSEAVGEPVDGLLGYSFLKHFRIAIDARDRVLWLDPLPEGWDDRPYEYSHVGIQIERGSDGGARVVSIARGSPAEDQGIAAGDVLVAVEGESVIGADLIAVARTLEGPPGSEITLTLRRGAVERTYRLARRRLL